ncbi:unnamed protein product [Urochloa humidicola]
MAAAETEAVPAARWHPPAPASVPCRPTPSRRPLPSCKKKKNLPVQLLLSSSSDRHRRRPCLRWSRGTGLRRTGLAGAGRAPISARLSPLANAAAPGGRSVRLGQVGAAGLAEAGVRRGGGGACKSWRDARRRRGGPACGGLLVPVVEISCEGRRGAGGPVGGGTTGGAPNRAATKASCSWAQRSGQAAAADLGAVSRDPSTALGEVAAAFARDERHRGAAPSSAAWLLTRLLCPAMVVVVHRCEQWAARAHCGGSAPPPSNLVFVMRGLKPLTLQNESSFSWPLNLYGCSSKLEFVQSISQSQATLEKQYQ